LTVEDLLREQGELLGLDLLRRVIEGAHGNEFTDIVVEAVLEDRSIIAGDIVELCRGKPLLPAETASQAIATTRPKQAAPAIGQNRPIDCHVLLTSGRSGIRGANSQAACLSLLWLVAGPVAFAQID
jgi:hypothetical protein